MQAIEHAADHYNIDRRRCVVAGIAEGATIAMVSAYRQAQEFRGVIAVAPQYDSLYAPPPNVMSTPVPRYYLMVGVDDPALEDCRKYAEEYRMESLEVQLKVYEHLKDGFPENRTAELIKALKYVLSR
jgi:predicted esterase